jgi:hypothetical protein
MASLPAAAGGKTFKVHWHVASSIATKAVAKPNKIYEFQFLENTMNLFCQSLL